MKKFPSELRHGSGVPMRLDATRLLLSFKESLKKGTLESVLKTFKLELEPDGKAEQQPNNDRVNQTDRCYWVRTMSGQTIDEQQFDNLSASLQKEFLVAFVGPVYQLSNTEGRGGLLCPFPNVLLPPPLPFQQTLMA